MYRKRILGSFFFAMAILVAVAVMVSISFQQMNRQKDWVAHTYEVIDYMQDILSGMKDVQSAQRGYLITGSEEYLDPYYESLEKLPLDMAALKALLKDNPGQTTRFIEVSGHITKRIDIARHMIDVYKTEGRDAAFSNVKKGHGKHEMDYIRSITADMITEEKRLLAERRHAMDAHTKTTIYAGIAGIVICFIILMAVFYQIHKETLANLELQKALREQSIRDPLTGLYNRRYMEETMEREIARAQRNKESMAVMVVDLDHFKKINDTYGHDGGDMVLTNFAEMVNKKTRKEDIACRIGGEEFVIILPGATAELAHKRAAEMCGEVRIGRFVIKGAHTPVTASIGVAAFPAHGQNATDLIMHADMALYQAKHSGRDQVVVYQAPKG